MYIFCCVRLTLVLVSLVFSNGQTMPTNVLEEAVEHVSSNATSTVQQTTVSDTDISINQLVWTSSQNVQLNTQTSVLVAPLVANQSIFTETPSRTELLFKGSVGTKFWALSTDYHRRRIIYTDLLHEVIGIYNVMKSSVTGKFHGISFGIDGISVDWITGNVYWTDTKENWLMVADSSFNYYQVIANLDSALAKIAVDSIHRHIFWSESKTDGCFLWRSDLNGRDKVQLHTFSDVQSIEEITYDAMENRLYWVERYRGDSLTTTSRVRWFIGDNTTSIFTAFTLTKSYLTGIASFKDQLFVCDKMSNSIISWSKSDSQTSRFTTRLPRAVATYGPDVQPSSLAIFAAHPCWNNSCGQLCLAGQGTNFKCACTVGYHMLEDNKTCGVKLVDDNFMLVADESHGKIFQIPLNAPNNLSALPLVDLGRPHSVAYDVVSKMLYFADPDSRSISRSMLDGVNREVFLSSVKAYSISLDTVSRNLYFADVESDSISVASLHHPNISKTLQIHNIFETFELYVDEKLGKVFWSDWGSPAVNNRPPDGRIESCNLDGSSRKVHVLDLHGPQSIAVDNEGLFLYWTELIVGNIGWFDLRTGKQGQYSIDFSAGNNRVTGIAFFNNTIYVSDLNRDSIYMVAASQVRSNSTPEAADKLQTFGKSVFFSPSAILIYSSQNQVSATSPCTATECPQICLPGNLGKYNCTCADHYNYSKSANLCNLDVASKNDKTPPSFGGTCPKFITVIYSDQCSTFTTYNFSEPRAKDNFGGTVKILKNQKSPPYNLSLGIHIFHYVAQDLAKNTANCNFIIIAKNIVCPLRTFERVVGQPTCANRYGSEVRVACPSGNRTITYRCEFGAMWVTDKFSTCSSEMLTTTQLAVHSSKPLPTPLNSHLSAGVTALIVTFVILVLIAVVLVILKLRNKGFGPDARWRHGDDTVYLIVDDNNDEEGPKHSGTSNVST